MQLLFHFRLSTDKIKLDILQINFTIPLPSHNRMFSFYTDQSFQSSIIKNDYFRFDDGRLYDTHAV